MLCLRMYSGMQPITQARTDSWSQNDSGWKLHQVLDWGRRAWHHGGQYICFSPILFLPPSFFSLSLPPSLSFPPALPPSLPPSHSLFLSISPFPPLHPPLSYQWTLSRLLLLARSQHSSQEYCVGYKHPLMMKNTENRIAGLYGNADDQLTNPRISSIHLHRLSLAHTTHLLRVGKNLFSFGSKS